MREILDRLEGWLQEGKDVALATIVDVRRKAPRDVGTTMAVTRDGEVAGSVSGGCVEPAIIEAAMEVLHTGEPRLLQFGISDDQALEVGLSCGGAIDVFIERVRPS